MAIGTLYRPVRYTFCETHTYLAEEICFFTSETDIRLWRSPKPAQHSTVIHVETIARISEDNTAE